ncbi:MAG: PD-(D/E)XK nuclease family protein [Elusimicrobiota bacterium]
MLNVFSSSSYKNLEKKLISRISQLQDGSWQKVCVVVPTARMLNYLTVLLSHHSSGFINIQLYTFSSFVDEIFSNEVNCPKPIFSDSHFYDNLVKDILREDRPFSNFEDLAVPDGFPPSVRSTLRDLIDAGIEPDKLGEALREHNEFALADVDVGNLLQLMQLYRLYLRRIGALPVLPRSEVLPLVIQQLKESEIIGSLKEIIFYGFYDMTGLQSDFLTQISSSAPCSFFLPFDKLDSDFQFSGRFRIEVLQKIPHEETFLDEIKSPLIYRLEQSSTPTLFKSFIRSDEKQVYSFSVSGIQDEIWALSTEIWRLHDQEKIPFYKMAIISRSELRLNGLAGFLETVHIPFNSTGKSSFVITPQFALLDRLFKTLQLKDVLRRENELKELLPLDFPEKEVLSIPAYGTWNDYIVVLEPYVEKLKISQSKKVSPIWDLVISEIEQLRCYRLIKNNVSWEEFLQTALDRFKILTLPKKKQHDLGVSLLHAEAARGLSFDVVFMVGLEEKNFPRAIREDPFLRDNARTVIFNTLGHKIGAKMNAVEEERLLFRILKDSAQKFLYFSFQRTDDDGKIVGVSPFLRSFYKDLGFELDDVVNLIPRPLIEKLKVTSFEFLDKRKLLMAYLYLDDKKAGEFWKEMQLPILNLGSSLHMIKSLESFSASHEYDAVFKEGFNADYVYQNGLSATSLERFGRCPFQFFISDVLKLSRVESIETLELLEAKIQGKIVHYFFQFFFERFAGKKVEKDFNFDVFFQHCFSETIDKTKINIYPLLWKSIKTRLFEDLLAAFRTLSEDLNQRQLIPTYFEKSFETSQLPSPLNNIKWRGVMDRVDMSSKEVRILDYKTGKRPKRDSDILKSVLTLEKAQASLYLLLVEQYFKDEKMDMKELSFTYFFIKDGTSFWNFTYEQWHENREELIKKINNRVGLIKKGFFPLIPSHACDYCDVKQVCRVNDSISNYRVSQTLPVEFLGEGEGQ